MQVLSRREFFKTEAGAQARKELRQMAKSPVYSTRESYDVANDCKLSFVDRHINYLTKHPYVNAGTYLSNLRVMTKAKH